MGENLSILSPDEMDDIIGGDFSCKKNFTWINGNLVCGCGYSVAIGAGGILPGGGTIPGGSTGGGTGSGTGGGTGGGITPGTGGGGNGSETTDPGVNNPHP